MRRLALGALVVTLMLGAPIRASAYSVLAHEACVDALWATGIRPLLARRFPRATPQDLQAARAYAYGGSVIQDLGYYPFGSKFFSDLVHYVRSGDFVEALVRDARDVNELAFALGALAHYAADTVGHPEAVNPAVALMFPKLEAKYGRSVTYAESPASHVIVEFSFDIVQVAAGAYMPETYHDFIGFEVAQPLMDRAFRETYGLDAKDVFGDEELAISTYRKSVSELIPEFTRIAWRDKHDAIAKLIPNVDESAFVFRYSRQQYEHDFGTTYRKPGFFARVIGVFYRILPKIGPLRPLKFKTPNPEAEKLFEQSFRDVRARYGAALAAVGSRSLDLRNVNFDLGRSSAEGGYPLADKTYAKLLDRLAERGFDHTPAALRSDIAGYYARQTSPAADARNRGPNARIKKLLVEMRAASR